MRSYCRPVGQHRLQNSSAGLTEVSLTGAEKRQNPKLRTSKAKHLTFHAVPACVHFVSMFCFISSAFLAFKVNLHTYYFVTFRHKT